jgi:hypothetical protein
MDLQWLMPWQPIAGVTEAAPFEAELQRELVACHPLFGVAVNAIGVGFNDDVLFQLHDGSDRVAVVHLTWRGRAEIDPRWPDTDIYDNLQDWIERGMKPDNDTVRKNAELNRHLT